MSQDSWTPSWIRGSKIQEIIWIGKDVVAWCSGVHIVFFNVAQRRQSLRWCWNQESGEGARCLSGHASLPIFCFAEKIANPRILIFSYPSMTKISECAGGCSSGYLATAFTPRDHVVSVGSYPRFPLIVWSWRTGERLVTVNTPIRDEVGQILRITLIGPTVIAQMGRTCGRLLTWQFEAAGKVAILKDHEVTLPNKYPILGVDWSPTSSEPLLAITDKDGHIFLSNYDGSEVQRIVLSQRCGICMDVELPMVCWFREGIVLRTTFCQIRFFMLNPRTNRWQRQWYVKSVTRPCILVNHPLKNDWLFYHTREGYLMQIDFSVEGETPRIRKYLNYGGVYRFADFVYPWCHHLVASDDRKDLSVVECYSGTLVSVVDPEIEGEISCQVSHPDYPVIVLGTTHGELVFVTLFDPAAPKIAAYLRLHRRPLDLIKFSKSGRQGVLIKKLLSSRSAAVYSSYSAIGELKRWHTSHKLKCLRGCLIAIEKKKGICFCVSLHRDRPYTVKALLESRRMIADALIYETHRALKVLLLFVGVKQFSVGQQMIVFDVPEGKTLVTEVKDVIDLPGVYGSLWQVPGNATHLLGSPYLTRQLRVQRLQDFKDVVITDALMTGHYVRVAHIFVDRRWITTTAFDGLVIVRDKSIRRIVAYIMTHHRADFGSVKAMMNKSGDVIVCLGYNGSLVAVRTSDETKKESLDAAAKSVDDARIVHRVDYSLYEKQKKKILSDYASLDPAVHDVLSRPKFQLPGPEEGDKTWAEWREEEQLREEEAKCKEEKAAILKDFHVLQGKVKKLLDANEACPEIEKLPVASFDLDIAGRDQKLKAGRDECEDFSLAMEHDCREMDGVATWIRENFWDPQVVLGKSLLAIFNETEVTNYPVVAEDPETKDHLQWANFCREAVQNIVEENGFKPWKLYTEEELQEVLSKRVTVYREEDRGFAFLLEEEEDKEVEEEELRKQREMEGTTTHRFIEPAASYSQMESYGFGHVMLNNRFLLHDGKRLRAYFNDAFDRVYELKERQMNVIRGRIERIRHIDSELSIMFGQRVRYVPADPDWHWQEKPESIIKVLDHEVKAKPYISPSQREILEKQAAEEERVRQLLLADDFRERALMAMMDGVLEVRWEDVIKIDVPKPACVLEKKPGDYTAEDILTVKRYEKDVQFLQEERERYKRMLEAEYTRVMGLMQEGIDNFNGKVDELSHLKINIESAINQIHLRYIRGCMRTYRRMKALREEEEMKAQITEKQQYAGTLETHLQAFKHVLQEFVGQHETLRNRERVSSRRFKSEFSSLNKLQTELLEQQFKRRPKTNLKNLSANDFLELGSHVVARTRPTFMVAGCMEYLRAIDYLDVRPNALPPSLDNAHWDQLVRTRRLRIELELKIRAKEAEIMDTESVIFRFEQSIEKCRADVEEATRNLEETRRRWMISELNVEVQMVLKMGQVEVDLAGDLEDTRDAILVPETEIEAVNSLIRAAGACKLDALTRLLNFQRGTLLMQWEHECKRKRLEDLQEDLRFTESVTVTKEMQGYLKLKARGLKDDKTPQRLQLNVEVMQKRLEGIVAGHRNRLRSIENEIAAIRSKNGQLDRQIFEGNVARCDLEQQRDLIGEAKQREHAEKKLRMIMKRSDLIKKLQDNYAKLLELQTEHELLRLRRYPMLCYKTVDDRPENKEIVRPARLLPSKPDFCPC